MTYIYTVQSGDTVTHIGEQLNVTVASIVHSNPGLNPNHIFVGQKLNIDIGSLRDQPEPHGTFHFYTIRSGDTLKVIQNLFGDSTDALNDNNPGVDFHDLTLGREILVDIGK